MSRGAKCWSTWSAEALRKKRGRAKGLRKKSRIFGELLSLNGSLKSSFQCSANYDIFGPGICIDSDCQIKFLMDISVITEVRVLLRYIRL